MNIFKSEFVEMFGENPVESGKWKVETLGEIGKVSMCKRILREQTTLEGDIPFYKIGTFGKKADAYIAQHKVNSVVEAFRMLNDEQRLICYKLLKDKNLI